MLNRRAFLLTIGALLAAAADVSIDVQTAAALPLPTPDIDWQAWNRFELIATPTQLRVRINGEDVTAHPDIVRVVQRFVHLEPEAGTVFFGFTNAQGSARIGYTMPEPVGPDYTLHARVTMKMTSLTPDIVYFDDMYLGEYDRLSYKQATGGGAALKASARGVWFATCSCTEYVPDHNGECLNCDGWADAHGL